MNRTKTLGDTVLKLVLVSVLGLVFQLSVFAVTPKSTTKVEDKPGIVLYAWEEDDESDGRR
ncbi:MAG: hypothetical protein KKI09_16955 [Spirochaetes bacterium]|nr:hypothetical protein [Spirochaetota bacterium]MBU0957116.1 hypothetical protein [Spirochaetota bacterium]